jgi:hypothetical protein
MKTAYNLYKKLFDFILPFAIEIVHKQLHDKRFCYKHLIKLFNVGQSASYVLVCWFWIN